MTETNNNQENIIKDAVRQFADAGLRGEPPDIDEFIKDYPGLEHQIEEGIKNLQKIDTLFDSLVQADEGDFDPTATDLDLVGKKVGGFEIEEVIGRGGMGVVYLAHDTKLDRSVAVKSIPAELQASSTAQARFKREAKLLASLNHPNIAVIHEIVEEEKSGYLILEYIPGETLAERIAREPPKLEEALSIGQQIAEAVSAAHENGVIHRDLKPGNIKIMPDGRVKVLDFGLAKASASEGKPVDTTVTQPGRIMGTPVYMSPEQARGKPTDKRSDIWSFGCIMYQMLTGQLPFEGETSTDTLARVIERQPDWQALPQETPANISILLRRCLEKDPQQRLRDIGDACIEIQETLNLPEDFPPQATTLQAARQPLSWQRLIMTMTVCVIMGIIITGAGFWIIRPFESTPTAAVRSFTIIPETESLGALGQHSLAFSPDGGLLAYIGGGNDGQGRIYLRDMQTGQTTPLAGTENAIGPFFSPDGQWVAYFDSFQEKLKKVSIKGTDPIVLTESEDFQGGTWGTDGYIFFGKSLNREQESLKREQGLWRVSASTGRALEQLTDCDPNLGEFSHKWPQILPDGEHVLFTNVRLRGLHHIEVYSLRTRRRSVLFKRHGLYARYLPTGHILYGSNETLNAVAFDLTKLQVSGPHVPVVQNVITSSHAADSAQFTFARDGSLAYIPLIASKKLEPVWVTKDKDGTTITNSLAITRRNCRSVSVSPDGAYVAFRVPLRTAESNRADLWIYDIERQTEIQLARDIGPGTPVWTPDSNEVIYFLGEPCEYFRHKIGTEEPELIAVIREWFRPRSCSPDGKVLLAQRWNPKMGSGIWAVPLDEGSTATARPVVERPYNEGQGTFSRDGKWIAYVSDETGVEVVYVEPYPGPGPRKRISIGGGYQPVWSRGGTKLFYRSGEEKMVAATIETEPKLEVTYREELFDWKYLSSENEQTYDVAPDGRFIMIRDPEGPPRQQINVVLNWLDELKRLVPTGKD